MSEGLEEQSHRRLDLGVRIQDDVITGVMDEADRNHLLELAATGAAQNAPAKARLEHMQFGLAHRALQAQ